VHEPEPSYSLPVRKELRAELSDELVPAAQVLAADLHIYRIVVQRCGHRDHWKFRARDTCRFKDALIAYVKTLNLSVD
jgi:hypothetical protein